MIKAIEWCGDSVRFIDQTKLPETLVYLDMRSVKRLWRAIRELSVRGAPAIGVAAAFGPVIAAASVDTVMVAPSRSTSATTRLRATRARR